MVAKKSKVNTKKKTTKKAVEEKKEVEQISWKQFKQSKK